MTADIRDVALPERLLRLAEVCYRVGLGKSMIYEMIGDGRFPSPIKITAAAARWSAREVDSWIAHVIKDSRANGSTASASPQLSDG